MQCVRCVSQLYGFRYTSLSCGKEGFFLHFENGYVGGFYNFRMFYVKKVLLEGKFLVIMQLQANFLHIAKNRVNFMQIIGLYIQ